ncbi:MAG TPA: HD domain-containing protein [Dehalococcoidia bacterium]
MTGVELEGLLTALRRFFASQGAEAYVVGGFLRDTLLGRPSRDLDLAVTGDADALARRLADTLGGAYVPLDESHGIFRVVLAGHSGPVDVVDLSRLRGDLLQDLAERDFTVDAMAAPLEGFRLDGEAAVTDPFGGREDLRRRVIRMVRPEVFRDDGLRLMRAARLAAELAFELDGATVEQARADAGCIERPSPERKRDELCKIMATRRAARALRQLDEMTVLTRLIPELEACRGTDQPLEHYWDVFNHSIEAVAAFDFMLERRAPRNRRLARFWRDLWDGFGWVPNLPDLFEEEVREGVPRKAVDKIAALLHDIGKPRTKSLGRDGRIHFFGHAELGAELATGIMRRFRFSRRETEMVRTIVDQHLRPGQLSTKGPPTRRALYRYFRDLGEVAVDVLFLNLADHLAARGPTMHPRAWKAHVGYMEYVVRKRYEEESIVRPPKLISGHDVMQEFGLTPGPVIGRLLAAVQEAQAAGEVTTREEALELVRRELEQERLAGVGGAGGQRRGDG